MLLRLDSNELAEAILLTSRSGKLLLQVPTTAPASGLLLSLGGLRSVGRGSNSVRHTISL